jgi:hypothetical protein
MEDNIKIDLKELWWDGVEWINPAQDKEKRRTLVNTVTNFQVPQNAGKCLE